MVSSISRRPLALLALVGPLALAACGEDPVGSDTHPAPVEVRIEALGINLANATELQSFGALNLTEGVETEVEAMFFNADFTPFQLASDHWLEVVFDDGTVAGWETDREGSFVGKLTGTTSGSTQVRFRLMHGAVGATSAHADFIPAKISVNVTP